MSETLRSCLLLLLATLGSLLPAHGQALPGASSQAAGCVAGACCCEAPADPGPQLVQASECPCSVPATPLPTQHEPLGSSSRASSPDSFISWAHSSVLPADGRDEAKAPIDERRLPAPPRVRDLFGVRLL